MSIALIAVLVAVAAPAKPPMLPLPLPGYAAPSAGFPSPDSVLGAPEDPLEGLTSGRPNDLRDALISPPSPAWLMGQLRASDPGARLAAIHSAAIPRHAAAIPHLTGVLLRLDEKPELRAAAADSLGRIGDRLAVKPLSEALSDPVPSVRYASALALGRLPYDGAVTRLSRALRVDPVLSVRYAAAIALGRARKAFAVPALAERLRAEPEWQVRLQVVRSLEDIGGEAAARAAADALFDQDSGVRTAAAIALSDIGTPAQLPVLREALRQETDSSTRAVLSATYRGLASKR